MRAFSLVAVVVSALVAVVGAADFVPGPAPGAARTVHQVSRQEIVARANHPDLFRKRQDTSSSDTSDTCTESPGRRRAFHENVNHILTASEMAAFLLGRGSFQWDNGTTYYDEEYERTLERKANSHQGRYHRLYNVVRDSLGNKLLELSIPAYKRWKTTLSPGELVYLSTTTALRGKDVEILERIFLDDPDFVDVQVQGFRVNRRFFEVSNSY